MPDFRDFRISSEQPTDLIVGFWEGRTSFEWKQYSFNHTLGFAPLCIGFWSDTEDFTEPIPFSIAQGINYMDPTTHVSRPLFESVSLIVTTTSMIFNSKFASDRDVYYRIYAFMPTDLDLSVATTSQLASRYILNSDWNYRKIYMAGDMELTLDTSTRRTALPVTISHNLGYRPQVMVWIGNSQGTVQELSYAQTEYRNIQRFENSIEVSNSDIVVTAPWPQSAGVAPKLYYRIYLDEA